jgi:microcystin-dependent protein
MTLCWCGKEYIRGRCPLHGVMGDPNLAVAEAAASTYENAVDAAAAANPLLAILPDLVFIWRKSVADIPAGWHLCDGTTVNGVVTVDLRDKFLVGAGNTYAVDATGGEATHLLTASESGVPAHTHPPTTAQYALTAYEAQVASGGPTSSFAAINAAASTTGDNATAPASTAHNNLPPYHSLCFIQYVGV